MFTTPAPAAPTLSTSASQASPSSPTRTSRLRGLSYLRSYTHNHLYSGSHSSPSTAAAPRLAPAPRLQNTPSEGQPAQGNSSPSADSVEANGPTLLAAQEVSSIQRSASPGSTGGWLPSVGLRSGLSRVSTLPDTTSPDSQDNASRETRKNTQSSNPSDSMRAMTRNRSETAASTVPAARGHGSSAPRTISAPDVHMADAPRNVTPPQDGQLPTIRLTSHQDPRANRPSLVFPPISRTLPNPSSIIRVGRYSERDSSSGYLYEPAPGVPSHAPVGFKSKVVSRRHCEFWCANGQWYIKDVGSSSGTFLNHIRLSQPGVESKPYSVNDGDVVQLGIDFRGGEEMIFRCVKIRVECNRGWQKGLNNFNKQTHKRLKNLAKTKPKVDDDAASAGNLECSICLMSVAPCQSLFVAPCSHTWHYKCIRPILNGHTWPNFLCPNCRAVADLDADVVEDDVKWSDDEDEERDPNMLRAIEESLRDSQTRNEGERMNAEGEAVRSLDVTDARNDMPEGRSMSMGPSGTLDAVAGASSQPRRSSDMGRGTGISHGQNANDNSLTVRPQRQQHSAAASTSGRHREQTRQQDVHLASDAELAALVQSMNLTSPDGTPFPPPPNATNAAGLGSGLAAPTPATNGSSLRTRPNGDEYGGDDDETHADVTRAIPINTNGTGSSRARMPRTNTPNPLRQEADASREIGGPECPMTPRNDAGPFILDGSGTG